MTPSPSSCTSIPTPILDALRPIVDGLELLYAYVVMAWTLTRTWWGWLCA